MSSEVRQIYLDNAATTPVATSVLHAMLPYYTENFANPSSLYGIGQNAKSVITEAREQVARALNADGRSIYFTSGGTESDNWALKETALELQDKGKHIITSGIEHHAVSHSCKWLEQRGFEVTYLPVDANGLINPSDLKSALRSDTTLVSIILANNEIGTIEPIAELTAVTHEAGALFHTDAVQAITYLPIDVQDLGVDMLSGSAHKFHGPKGTGFLYIKPGVKVKNYLDGGAQERNRRAGTENVAGIVGLAAALELCLDRYDQRINHLTTLRDRLIDGVLTQVDYCKLNGDRNLRLPNNANFSFEFVEGESLLLMLEQKGILGSSGSACASGSLDPSHVLLAIGLPHEIAHGSLRLTLGDETSEADIDYTISAIKEVVDRLRTMSPLWEDFQKTGKSWIKEHSN